VPIWGNRRGASRHPYAPEGGTLWASIKGRSLSNILDEYISKEGGKWCVKSEKGKNLGCYFSEKEAKKRLRQIEYFKHK
jgi:hypothetical protein